jgi:hypothetical protein
MSALLIATNKSKEPSAPPWSLVRSILIADLMAPAGIFLFIETGSSQNLASLKRPLPTKNCPTSIDWQTNPRDEVVFDQVQDCLRDVRGAAFAFD